MSWTLQNSRSKDPDAQKYTLQDDSTVYIISQRSDGSAGIVHELPEDGTELGRITIAGGDAKLEAINDELVVSAGAEHQVGLETRKIAHSLQPVKNGRVEVLLLRDGDIISSSQAEGSLICTWEIASEVQVNSSVAETGAQKQGNGLDGVAVTPEDETEDEDLDRTTITVKATQTKSQQFQPTPQLSEQRSLVVHETPTNARVGSVVEYTELRENGLARTVEVTPTPDVSEQAGAQTYSTARTGHYQQQLSMSTDDAVVTSGARHRHGVDETPLADQFVLAAKGASSENQRGRRGPKVVVTKKRTSSVPDEVEPNTKRIEHTNKRAKRNPTTDDDTQDSVLSNIVVDTSPTIASAKKGRKRKSTTKEDEDLDEVTPQTHGTSQRSASTVNADSYLGETPRVATSNSAITEKSQAAKFLKKQGGSLVDSVKDIFNVLCVRDGELVKTPKVLQAIAAGVPIVTDKWLIDSAKASRLLSIDAYQPHAPKQEDEWDIKLDDILGKPQTPFRGYILHFTSSAHAIYNPFTDIEHVCKTAGAEKITTKKKIGKTGKIVVIAAETGDKEAEQLVRDGIACYHRGILPMSIFRGALDLESEEFMIGSDGGATASKANDTETKRARRR